jgi:hypothetical protein
MSAAERQAHKDKLAEIHGDNAAPISTLVFDWHSPCHIIRGNVCCRRERRVRKCSYEDSSS